MKICIKLLPQNRVLKNNLEEKNMAQFTHLAKKSEEIDSSKKGPENTDELIEQPIQQTEKHISYTLEDYNAARKKLLELINSLKTNGKNSAINAIFFKPEGELEKKFLGLTFYMEPEKNLTRLIHNLTRETDSYINPSIIEFYAPKKFAEKKKSERIQLATEVLENTFSAISTLDIEPIKKLSKTTAGSDNMRMLAILGLIATAIFSLIVTITSVFYFNAPGFIGGMIGTLIAGSTAGIMLKEYTLKNRVDEVADYLTNINTSASEKEVSTPTMKATKQR